MVSIILMWSNGPEKLSHSFEHMAQRPIKLFTTDNQHLST